PLHALRERGVEYVEVRCIDLDPFCSIGITAEVIRFLDVFLLHCLLSDSPRDTPEEIVAMSVNQHRVAERGRNPNLRLLRRGEKLPLQTWGSELLHECEPVAAALDEAHCSTAYRDASAAAAAVLANPALTPSARVLRKMERDHDKSYLQFVQGQSVRHRRTLLALPMAAEVNARYTRMAEESFAAQRQIELQDTLPFEMFRQQYLSPDMLST
ncbi:MAG: glutamate--cysteine ligase, partial [Betaproteobacteria bacterium]|nr:glutamate--cysteine ligase [Betaproteobacteria bacterium]